MRRECPRSRPSNSAGQLAAARAGTERRSWIFWLSDRPMREPVFNETLQLGIVVRDLEATMRSYVDDYGIGP